MKRLFVILLLIATPIGVFPQEWTIPFDDEGMGYFKEMIPVDEGEFILGVGQTTFNSHYQDGFIAKIGKNGDFIYRCVNVPGKMLQYHSAVQLDNGNFMVFGVCDDTITNPMCIKYLHVELFNPDLETLDSWQYLVDDDVFDCFVDAFSGQILKSIKSRKGSVVLAARESFYTVAPYGNYYEGHVRFYEFDESGGIIRIVDDLSWDTQMGYIKKMFYAPHSDNLVLVIKGGSYPEGHTGCSGIHVVDTSFHVVARQHMLDLSSPFGIISDNACDGNWIDNDYLILDITKRIDGQNPWHSLFKVDSALHVYAELDLPPLADSCSEAPLGSTTAFINDSTIFVISYSRPSIPSDVMQQVNINLVDKHLNLLGRKVLRKDDYYFQADTPSAFNDGGCLVHIYVHNGTYFQGQPFIHKYLMKFRREDIEITWDVVNETETKPMSVAYPNPTKDIINIPIGETKIDKARLQIFDMKGAKCLDCAITKQGNLISLNVQNLETGAYVYHIVSNDIIISVGKFVKQ